MSVNTHNPRTIAQRLAVVRRIKAAAALAGIDANKTFQEAVDCHEATVRRKFDGISPISVDELENYAKLVGFSPADFFDDTAFSTTSVWKATVKA